jgi:tartrate dehydratase beta subunit/fumarate hydratase class I family protein
MRDRFSTAIYCNFCGKGKNEVGRMVASPGPDAAHICDDCIRSFALQQASILALAEQTSSAMRTLSALSDAALAAQAGTAIREAHELRFAANRAWHELSQALTLWLHPALAPKAEVPRG